MPLNKETEPNHQMYLTYRVYIYADSYSLTQKSFILMPLILTAQFLMALVLMALVIEIFLMEHSLLALILPARFYGTIWYYKHPNSNLSCVPHSNKNHSKKMLSYII